MAVSKLRVTGPLPAIARTGELLPRGGLLPEEVWERRHRAIVILLAAHAVAIAVLVVPQGFDVLHALLEGSVVGAAAVAAAMGRYSRRVRSMIASFGLLSASAILVHLSGGYIELHFHFFVMVIVISLYQDWWPFALAIAYVVLHHGIVGVSDPASVYNHPSAIANPWLWAGIHGAFIVAASLASMVAWRLNEDLARDRVRTQEEVAIRLRELLASEAAAHAAADRATRSKDAFFTRASHEIRTPLNAIIGFSDLLVERSTDLTERDRRYLDRIHTAGESLVTLLDKVLALAELESERPLDRVAIDGATFLVPLLETAASAGAAEGVSVATGTPPGPFELRADGRLGTALREMVRAAIEAAGRGGRLAIASRLGDSHLVIEVTTSGTAAEDEEIERIFDPFPTQFVENGSEVRPSRLGLAFAKRVVELHGGSVAAERASEGGTVLRVRLPIMGGVEGDR